MTPIIHELEIVSKEEFPEKLQKNNDLPADIIVTPQRIINVKPKRLPKPNCGILWDQVDKENLSSLAILELMKK